MLSQRKSESLFWGRSGEACKADFVIRTNGEPRWRGVAPRCCAIEPFERIGAGGSSEQVVVNVSLGEVE
mgnify:CR=1 FL=1